MRNESSQSAVGADPPVQRVRPQAGPRRERGRKRTEPPSAHLRSSRGKGLDVARRSRGFRGTLNAGAEDLPKKRLRSTEGNSRVQNYKNRDRFLRAGFLQLPHGSTQVAMDHRMAEIHASCSQETLRDMGNRGQEHDCPRTVRVCLVARLRAWRPVGSWIATGRVNAPSRASVAGHVQHARIFLAPAHPAP